MGQVFTRTALMLSVVLVFANVSAGQQVADPNFDPTVAHPAFTKNHPRVLFDEAHNNFHTAGGRYKAFADLINSDGYRVTPNSRKFSAETLAGYDVLVIANPLGAPVESPSDFPTANKPAFTEAMLTAQLAGPEKAPFGGLNVPGIDNKQLALNIMHWLSRLTS